MSRTTPISDDAQAQIRALAGQGLSRNHIARTLGVSPSTVRKYAADAAFDRQATAAATQAKQLDNRARRAEQVTRMLDLTDRILGRLEGATYTTRIKVADSSFVVTDDQIPSEDERNHVSSLTNLATTIARLETIDADAGAAGAVSMLKQLGDALGVSGPTT